MILFLGGYVRIMHVIAICRELFTAHQLSSHPTIHVNSMEVVQVPFKFSCLEVPPVVSNVFSIIYKFNRSF